MKKRDAGFVFLVAILVVVVALGVYFLSMPSVYLAPGDVEIEGDSIGGGKVASLNEVTVKTIGVSAGNPLIDIFASVLGKVYPVDFADFEGDEFGKGAIRSLTLNPQGNLEKPFVLVPSREVCELGVSEIPVKITYLVPPGRVTEEEIVLPVAREPSVTRVMQSGVSPGNFFRVILYIYCGCGTSYKVSEALPEFAIVDAGGASVSANVLTWQGLCSEEHTVLSYVLQAPSNLGNYPFSGTFSIPSEGESKQVMGNSAVLVKNVDCYDPDSWTMEPACEEEYCNPSGTLAVYEGNCVNACTGREGYVCRTSCDSAGFESYDKGDAACGGMVCCREVPTESCKQIGGYCTEQGIFPEGCPKGFLRYGLYDQTCNAGATLLLADSQICCVPAGDPVEGSNTGVPVDGPGEEEPEEPIGPVGQAGENKLPPIN